MGIKEANEGKTISTVKRTKGDHKNASAEIVFNLCFSFVNILLKTEWLEWHVCPSDL